MVDCNVHNSVSVVKNITFDKSTTNKTIKQIQQLEFLSSWNHKKCDLLARKAINMNFDFFFSTCKNYIYSLYLCMYDRCDQNMRYFCREPLYYHGPNEKKKQKKNTVRLSFLFHSPSPNPERYFIFHLFIYNKMETKTETQNSYFNSVFACSCKLVFTKHRLRTWNNETKQSPKTVQYSTATTIYVCAHLEGCVSRRALARCSV